MKLWMSYIFLAILTAACSSLAMHAKDALKENSLYTANHDGSIPFSYKEALNIWINAFKNKSGHDSKIATAKVLQSATVLFENGGIDENFDYQNFLLHKDLFLKEIEKLECENIAKYVGDDQGALTRILGDRRARDQMYSALRKDVKAALEIISEEAYKVAKKEASRGGNKDAAKQKESHSNKNTGKSSDQPKRYGCNIS